MVQCGAILYLGAEEVWCSVVRCYISRSWLDKLFFFTGDDGRVRVCGEGIAGTWETEAVSRSWGLAVSEPHFMAGNAGACSGISSVGVGRFFGHWFFFRAMAPSRQGCIHVLGCRGRFVQQWFWNLGGPLGVRLAKGAYSSWNH